MVSVGLMLGFIGGMLMGTDKKSIKSYWNTNCVLFVFFQHTLRIFQMLILLH